MSDSLQDQLRALGLAKEKSAAKKRSKRPKRPKSPAKKTGGLSLEQAYALREKEEKAKADRARQRKQAEDRKRREINQKIRAIVDQHRQNRDDAERARNFLYKGRIRKVHVTDEQFKALNSGALGVVYLSGGYHLLAPEQVENVRTLSAEHVPDLEAGDGPAEDEFPVPDDISW